MSTTPLLTSRLTPTLCRNLPWRTYCATQFTSEILGDRGDNRCAVIRRECRRRSAGAKSLPVGWKVLSIPPMSHPLFHAKVLQDSMGCVQPSINLEFVHYAGSHLLGKRLCNSGRGKHKSHEKCRARCADTMVFASTWNGLCRYSRRHGHEGCLPKSSDEADGCQWACRGGDGLILLEADGFREYFYKSLSLKARIRALPLGSPDHVNLLPFIVPVPEAFP